MDFFRDKKIVIATMHGKEKVIARLFKEAFTGEVFVPDMFDTDEFGTFTRDKKRRGNQIEAARAKASAALLLTDADIAIASEGSFTPHPDIPFLSIDRELVLLIDKEKRLEVEGYAVSVETNFAQIKVTTLADAVAFAKRVGFPEHGVIVRRSSSSRTIYKDIATWDAFESAITSMLGGWLSYIHPRAVFLETDMRAHKNPTRMKVIENATKNLIDNLKKLY